MPDDERSNLEVAVARVEEQLKAQAARIGRIEWLVGGVALAVIGGIVSRVL